MENAEQPAINGDAKPAEQAPPKKPESRSKCGKCRNGKESLSKKQQKVDDGYKSLEELKKALSSVTTQEEKITLLCEKYADLLEDNRKLALAVKQGEKRALALQAEKEHVQNDSTKAILTKARLENLCRELQRQNKIIKDESLARIKEEEEKRKELSTRFNVTLNEITTLMQTNTEKNNQLREENKALTEKFKIICEQYELRESQVEKLMKQSQLEGKLSETKLAKVQVELMQEKELLLRELSSYQTQLKQQAENEDALRGQIRMYSEKYEEFQQALAKSNEVFSNFKAEMDKMSKKIIKLEKETCSWKQRWENSHSALCDMIADKQQRDEELLLAGKQVAQLQRLCRTLQEERTKHIAKLREHGEELGKAQPVMKKEEIDELLEKQPKPPLPMPVIDSAPIIDVEEEVPGTKKSDEVPETKNTEEVPETKKSDEVPETKNSEEEVATNGSLDNEQTEKKSSADKMPVSLNDSETTTSTNEPVPESEPEQPSSEKSSKQSTPVPDKKKAKETGRKKKK
ncbi:beta-taxilin [Neocloeon triangulifer]|uniref:beta-taxilin n=1 Tax=Neocloeon triangulifer TaxID=2078957 RepID=UPI00286EC528|nr:beta-taxilin [Neocloeon triangulifer]XP_059469505.1 beta-taxilin [Neocloeon triangulifer]XP_059469514.1 beta-taxilin [Neocloeon triangulifer]